MTEIEGRAWDQENNIPVVNSRVVFKAEDGTTTEVPTDEVGEFSTDIEPGVYDITLLSQMYQPVHLEDVVIEGAAQEITFRTARATLG